MSIKKCNSCITKFKKTIKELRGRQPCFEHGTSSREHDLNYRENGYYKNLRKQDSLKTMKQPTITFTIAFTMIDDGFLSFFLSNFKKFQSSYLIIKLQNLAIVWCCMLHMDCNVLWLRCGIMTFFMSKSWLFLNEWITLLFHSGY